MSNWKSYQLKDIGLIKTGKTPPSSCQNAFSDYGIPFVTPKDMTGVKTIFKTERYLSDSGLKTVKNYLVPKNSIAVSCIGSDMGKAYLLSRDSITNQQINTLIVNNKHNFEFIYYKLSTLQDYLKSIAGGSATPILNKSHFSELEIELPDLETQNYIVEKLKFLDEKIQLNTQINQTLEQIAQAIFKSWFVDFDPVRAKAAALASGKTDAEAELAAMQAISGKSAEELAQMPSESYAELAEIAKAFPSEFGEDGVPMGWEVKRIDEIIQKIPVGKKYSSKTALVEGSIPILDQGRSGVIGYHNDEAGVKASIDEPVIVFANHTCYMRFISYDFSAIQNVFAFKGKECDVFWVYLATLGKQKFVEYKGHFPDFLIKEIVMPSKELTELFGKYVKSNFSKIFINDKENAGLAKVRDLLLPRLLNGEI